MRISRRRKPFTLNLDSLTDIVTCSVGILIFFMLNGVLAAGRLSVNKRLPMVQGKTSLRKVVVLCTNNTARPFDVGRLIDAMIAETPPPRSYHGVPGWAKQWNGKVKADEYALVRAYGGYFEQSFWLYSSRQIDVGVYIEPQKNQAYDTIQNVSDPASHFNRLLNRINPQKEFVSFLVDPQSLEIFERCTEIARSRNINIGWQPILPAWPFRISFTGSSGGGPDVGGPQW